MRDGLQFALQQLRQQPDPQCFALRLLVRDADGLQPVQQLGDAERHRQISATRNSTARQLHAPCRLPLALLQEHPFPSRALHLPKLADFAFSAAGCPCCRDGYSHCG